MSHKNLSSIPWFDQNWPKAADQRSADLFSNAVKEAWVKNNKDPVLIQQPDIVRLIHAIGGNSPFLADPEPVSPKYYGLRNKKLPLPVQLQILEMYGL